MSRIVKIVAIAAFVSASTLPSTSALAQPSGLGDLVGARAAGAETEMQARGYSNADFKGGAQYWWNASSRTCARVVVANGRYASVTAASASDCGHSSGGSAAGAVAGIAAIGLIAALASHHSKTDNRHKTQANHDSDYERGYNDALYGANYDNDDSEGYHSGYMAGEQERSNRRHANTSHVRNGAPQAALSACSRRADEYQNQSPGSSVPVSVYNYGQGLYEITMATGSYRSRCSVNANGRVTGMNPY